MQMSEQQSLFMVQDLATAWHYTTVNNDRSANKALVTPQTPGFGNQAPDIG